MSETKTRTHPETVRDALLAALKNAARHNRSDAVAPAAVLWVDRERHWEKVIAGLREDAPILTLGDYDPENFTGPAIWLRCAIAGTLPDDFGAGEGVPVLYLPDVGRADLRAVENCPKHLRPLAELQYRGAMFLHPNGRDMTPAGFLSNTLGIEVAGGREARDALTRALPRVLEGKVKSLEKKSPLHAGDFDGLLVDDPERDILAWMDDPKGYERAKTPETFDAFRQVCKRDFHFDPDSDGELHAVESLAEGAGPWKAVWTRFEEAPALYPNLPALLDRTSGPSQNALFDGATPYRPSDNEAEENKLRESLLELENSTAPEARRRIGHLEEKHGHRRGWVWSKLGRSPLANALALLAELCSLTENATAGNAPEDMAAAYAESGWRVDDLALRTLASVSAGKDASATKAAVRAVYGEWLETSAKRFQKAISENPVPAQGGVGVEGPEKGVCIMFVDGLRYDLAHRLSDMLSGVNETSLEWRFTALPGVTPTAKPCLSPAAPGMEPGEDLGAKLSGSKVTAQNLRKAISGLGYEILAGREIGGIEGGSSGGGAWDEFGDIDNLGHERGWILARDVEHSLVSIAERMGELFEAGWGEVRVVTDHGWLMLPGGLPKVDLPEHLTVMRKGRCARMKPDASTNYQTVPWTLDPEVRVAVAPGIGVFQGTDEYEHGGLSLQECVVPMLRVSPTEKKGAAKIAEAKWVGLRCKVRVEGCPEGATVDLRRSAANPGSSIVSSAKKVKDGGASLPVEDDSMEGSAALVVLVGSDGKVLAQRPTVVGG
ncbi:MAG: BREX-1 system phosphatase PglZ type B [Actinomycetota bacterium]|nr:BREX-1 system phosphatase PglZ type B [Actinomycetota bacterium]